MADRTQATNDDEPTTKPQPGDRVLVRPRVSTQPGFGITGLVTAVHDEIERTTYIVELDSGSEGTFRGDRLITEADLALLEKIRGIDDVGAVLDALEGLDDLLAGGL